MHLGVYLSDLTPGRTSAIKTAGDRYLSLATQLSYSNSPCDFTNQSGALVLHLNMGKPTR